jgi:F-type H+-transporting ATPase subunit delta
MASNQIASRYAKALLKIAGTDQSKAGGFALFLQAANQLFAIDETKKVLKSPVMPADLKRALLEFARSKSQAPSDVDTFSAQLIEAGRVNLIPEISSEFTRLLNERQGIEAGVVTTATPLSDNDRTSLQEALHGVFKKKINLDNKVDKKILGGLVVEVGNFVIDLSVKAKLESLAECAQV